MPRKGPPGTSQSRCHSPVGFEGVVESLDVAFAESFDESLEKAFGAEIDAAHNAVSRILEMLRNGMRRSSRV